MKKKSYFSYVFLIIVLLFLFTSSFLIVHTLNKGRDNNSGALKSPAKKSSEATPEPQDDIPVEAPLPELAEVLLTSVGDCTLGTDVDFSKSTSLPTVLINNNNDYSYFFKNVAHIFKTDDITTANLETTFTTSTTPWPNKAYNFKGDPELAKALTLGSIEGVNLSNNHIYDYKQEGFNDTIKALDSNNINYFGEGNKWITTVKGVKLGFLGYTGWYNDAKLLNKIKKDIEELKAEGCIVIINIHWGEERHYTPNATQKSTAHFAIDNGADLIIGHHPHVIQGIEKYKDRFIAYSLANFCFGGNSNPTDKDTFILQTNFKFTDKNLTDIGIKIIPCSVSSVSYKNGYSPTPMEGSSKNRLLEKLNKLSFNLDFKLNENFNYIKTE